MNTNMNTALSQQTIPRPEYPRPDFQRDEWLNLNGEWEFEFDDANLGEADRWYETGASLARRIVVPFCYQSEASGIGTGELHEIVWYRRTFELPLGFSNRRVLLHFGAVDYEAKVWVNGKLAGTHRGGNVPFYFDVTVLLKSGVNVIVLRAEDRYEPEQPRGKQYWKEKPDRCWYTATTGIWQTVWIETVGKIAIDRLRLTPNIDQRTLEAEVYLDKYISGTELQLTASFQGRRVQNLKVALSGRIVKVTLDIREEDEIDEVHYWSPEHPNLYDLEVVLVHEGVVSDLINSYFGMRKISVHGDLVMLNNRPYYQRLILDQGYWEKTLMTPPSDEDIKLDVQLTKDFGFNGARKHQKIEDPRYYYWADRLGLLVWGELPSAYRYNAEQVDNLIGEWSEFIKRDYNHPSIVFWVPLNESWGVRNIVSDPMQQAFGKALYYLTKSIDPTRLISTNDGWEQVQGDICAIHDYEAWGEAFDAKFHDLNQVVRGSVHGGRLVYAYGETYHGEPVLVTEYGGIAFENENSNNWGYNGAVQDEESFIKRFDSITSSIRRTPYIRGYCYTQLTDVMQEINGLLTIDRKPKVDVKRIREIVKK